MAVLAAVAAVRGVGRGWGLLDRTLETSGQLAIRIAVVMVFALGALADSLGLDLLLGGFVAGVIARIALEGREVAVLESKLTAVGYGFLIPFFFVVSGIKFDLDGSHDNPIELLELPLFLGLFLVVRGTPALLLYRGVLDLRDRAALAVFSATGLPLIVAITTIAVEGGTHALRHGRLARGRRHPLHGDLPDRRAAPAGERPEGGRRPAGTRGHAGRGERVSARATSPGRGDYTHDAHTETHRHERSRSHRSCPADVRGLRAGANFEGRIADELARLESEGTIRILDLLFVGRDTDSDELVILEHQEETMGAVVGALLGLKLDDAEDTSGDAFGMSAGEIAEMGAALPPGAQWACS